MFTRKFLRRKVLAGVAVVAAAVLGMAGAAGAAPRVGIQALDEVSGTANGTVFRTTFAAGTPLLSRFQYHYTSEDHHIRTVSAMPLPQQFAVEVGFADENGDDQYTYRVSHQRVDSGGLVPGTFHGTCAGQCTTALNTRPAGDFVFVLSGFRVTYDNADHHLDRIAVLENGGSLTTAFRDLNGDDRFTYDVSYVWVPRARLGTITTILSSAHAVGSASRAAVAGEKVIRGFDLDNLATGNAGDNHIKDLGVVGNFTSFDFLYGDSNPADSADWLFRADYATLA